jgi:crossover junction endodeoxyribonuclease RuvC
MFDTCVLGVDPGVASLGLAVLIKRERRPVLVWAETVRTSAGLAESVRLRSIAAAVRDAIGEHRPSAVALEQVAWNRNKVSALAVARATGVVMAVAAEAGVPVQEYSPSEVKNAVTGSGGADKDQIRTALVRVHALRDVPEEPDVADAAAVALTHLVGARMRAAGARAGAR